MRPIINRFNWRILWGWVKPLLIIVVPIFFIWLIWGCAPQYPITPVPIPQATEFKDPLAIDHRQRESVALLVDKHGDPEIIYSWAWDDFKLEVVRWKKPSLKYTRWAIRFNNIYKFTWTQFNIEKEINGATK